MKLFAMLCWSFAWPVFCDATYILEDIDDGQVIKIIISPGLQLKVCDATGCVAASFANSLDGRVKIKFAPPFAERILEVEFFVEELHDLLDGQVIGAFYRTSDNQVTPRRATFFLQ